MGVLILLSALFSGSEAALFSLTPRGRRRLVRKAGGPIADRLLQNPDRLLSAILFWNLLINMCYFAIVAIVGNRLETDPSSERSMVIVFTVLTLLAIIFFSEMLPKSLAVLMPVQLSAWVAPPLNVAVRLAGPVLPVVDAANRLSRRLVWPNFEPEPAIDLADIDRAIELGTHDAALQQRDRIAFHGLVEMAEIRATEIMRPRTKLMVCAAPVRQADVIEMSPPGGYVMVTDGQQKNITAAIPVRYLRPSQMDELESNAERVIYVPWSSHVSQVWEQLDDADVGVAVVVNEFGEVVGAITVDDILRRVLAPRHSHNDEILGAESFEEICTDQFRVGGSVSLRAFAKRLEIELPDETVATVAGYIQRQTERLPRVGDKAQLGRFTLQVAQQNEKVTWIDVRPHADDGIKDEVKS